MNEASRYCTFMIRRICTVVVLAVLSLQFSNAQEVRNLDGFGNNLSNPELGAAGSYLNAVTSSGFSDGIGAPGGVNRENPRIISNILFKQDDLYNDSKLLSDFNWVFGQFIDHDLTLVENADFTNPSEALVIIPPADDEFFSPGDKIFMMRSKYADGTGTSTENPRRYTNEITSFIDGSAVYGSDEASASWLRTFKDGKLKTSVGNLLPWNTVNGEFTGQIDPSAPHMEDGTHSNDRLFVAGDIRANENPLLIAIHTIFVREHNRNCSLIKSKNPTWDDEQIYQHAKRITSGLIQSIVYNEWLPSQGLEVPAYQGYNEALDPSISNVFSAAAFRMGHTLINSNIIRMQNDGSTGNGHITLRDAFFNPHAVVKSGGIDPFLKGMGTQVQQELDCKIIDDVRNFLFGAPGEGGLDLAAININRGRERGIPDYNTLREDFGLPRVATFTDICSDPEVSNRLESIYGSVDNLDAWVGMLAEDHMKNALYGELSMTIIERQFRLIRDGDRFYFMNDPALSAQEKQEISNTIFHDIIMRNTNISLMQDNVFMAMEHENIPNGPKIAGKVINAAIYPNPVDNTSKIKVNLKEASEVTVSMYDNMGNILRRESMYLEGGDTFINTYYFVGLPKGTYHIKVENDLGIFTLLRAIL